MVKHWKIAFCFSLLCNDTTTTVLKINQIFKLKCFSVTFQLYHIVEVPLGSLRILDITYLMHHILLPEWCFFLWIIAILILLFVQVRNNSFVKLGFCSLLSYEECDCHSTTCNMEIVCRYNIKKWQEGLYKQVIREIDSHVVKNQPHEVVRTMAVWDLQNLSEE